MRTCTTWTMMWISLCVVTLGLVVPARAQSKFVTRDGSRLMLEGREYRACGVNMPALFSEYVGNDVELNTPELVTEARARVLAGVEEAAAHRIPFIRFWASGFHARSMEQYFSDPEKYWAAMDEVFALARSHNIKLVPTIWWSYRTWPLISGEPYSAIADPSSKSRQAMEKYGRELVTRYKDDPNVLAWEISNELSLVANVNMEGRNPPHSAALLVPGSKPKQTVEDSLTDAQIHKYHQEMATLIKSWSPNHLVVSGDTGPRPTSVSLRESFPKQKWITDTARQSLAGHLAATPEPLDFFSIHHYGHLTVVPKGLPKGVTSPLDDLRGRIRVAHAAKLPVFIGELGNHESDEPVLSQDTEGKYVSAVLDLCEQENVSLVALWAWHFPRQPKNHFTAQTHRKMMERIARFNQVPTQP